MTETVTHHPATVAIDVYEQSPTVLRGEYLRRVLTCRDHLTDVVADLLDDGTLAYPRALPAGSQSACHVIEQGTDEPQTRSVTGQCPRCKNMSLWEIDGVVQCVDGCGPLPEIVVEGSLPGADELDDDEQGTDEPQTTTDDDTPQYTGIPALDTWAAANGWTWGYDYYRWTNPEQTTAIGYDDGDVKVWRRTPGAHILPDGPTRYPVDPERAVDLLVALRILPDTLHRLHSQVATVDELTDELHELRARLAQAQALRRQQRDLYGAPDPATVGQVTATPAPTGDAPQGNPERRCRYCDATTGLAMLPGNPLVLAPREWECADGYHKGGAR